MLSDMRLAASGAAVKIWLICVAFPGELSARSSLNPKPDASQPRWSAPFGGCSAGSQIGPVPDAKLYVKLSNIFGVMSSDRVCELVIVIAVQPSRPHNLILGPSSASFVHL